MKHKTWNHLFLDYIFWLHDNNNHYNSSSIINKFVLFESSLLNLLECKIIILILYISGLDADIDRQIDKYILNIGNEWSCTACGKSIKNRMALRKHIEALHIETPGFPCEICGFVSKTRHALRLHKDNRHKVKKWKNN